jgi:Heterokaryon incompatibility protein (HET)
MRLLRYKSNGDLELSNFTADHIPQYGILSHTWSYGEEVTYADILAGTGQHKTGYTKIRFCGERAVRDGLNFFWIDTCCIDKSSSSELNEAINSMFQWFRNAAKCYVYLSDVSAKATPARELSAQWEQHFRRSRWFTRAWTLQELVAPNSVEFFSVDGERLGDKSSLESLIHEITGIPALALRGEPLANFSISERLSWATSRTARYEEDRVYSLLGLFDVFMPIIYGEGYSSAFRRLQNEIQTLIPKSTTTSRTGMRLLVTRSDPLRLETVPIQDGLQYAILSHTWGKDEVTFEDMRTATAEQKSSYSKLLMSCNLAAEHGFEYLWVDTCCIDKSSSSELQEAICSMYIWYRNARICYVYLADYTYGDTESFAGCKWFTRGWTLREYLPFSTVLLGLVLIFSRRTHCSKICRVLRPKLGRDWNKAKPL